MKSTPILDTQVGSKLEDAEKFIREFSASHRRVPTCEEIRLALKLNWRSTAQNRINALITKGRLRKTEHGYALPESDAEDFLIPLLGSVAAGKPIEAVTTPDYIDVPKSLLRRGGEYFCLRVKGDSMIEDHILDEDIVVIKKQHTCEIGDTVVALVDGHATLKRYYKKKDLIELRPSNSKLLPIYVNPQDQEFRIAGVYAGLIRRNR